MTPMLLALAAIQSPALAAEEIAVAARYRACTELVRSDAERAIETANAWRVEGGGIYARECLGLAYVALGRWAGAATVYEQAARDAEAAQDPRHADFWIQAGNAWIAAGEGIRAVLALDTALATTNLTNELRGEAHLDRARALVALGNPAGARQDLDRALQLVASDPFAWYLSAALAKRQDDLVRARSDIARAMQLAPENPDIMLLAGTLAGHAGDMAEAERLYRRVAELAPDSDAGRAAQASLASPPNAPAPVGAPRPSPPRPQPQPQPATPQSR